MIAKNYKVFVSILDFQSRINQVVSDAIDKANSVYAQRGDVKLLVSSHNLHLNAGPIVEANTLKELAESDCVIFVISNDVDGKLPAGYLRSISGSSMRAIWYMARQSIENGSIKHSAIYVPHLSKQNFVDPPSDSNLIASPALQEFILDIRSNKNSSTYDSYEDLARSIEQIVIEWNLDNFNTNIHPDIIPEQSKQGLIFGGADDAPLLLIDLPKNAVLDTPDRRQVYADIRERAELLLAECGTSNRLAVLRSYSTRLLQAMGGTLPELKALSFWAPMNSLRRRAEADERVRLSPDPDDPPLPETLAALLLDLVDNLNVFTAYQPALAKLDELAQDPSVRVVTSESLAAARRLADAAGADPTIADQTAAESLREAASEASGDGPSAERAKQFSVRSARNFSLELIRRVSKAIIAEPGFAWKETRAGVYRTLGALIAHDMGLYIVQFEMELRLLIDTLGRNPMLHDIIDFIIRVFKGGSM